MAGIVPGTVQDPVAIDQAAELKETKQSEKEERRNVAVVELNRLLELMSSFGVSVRHNAIGSSSSEVSNFSDLTGQDEISMGLIEKLNPVVRLWEDPYTNKCYIISSSDTQLSFSDIPSYGFRTTNTHSETEYQHKML